MYLSVGCIVICSNVSRLLWLVVFLCRSEDVDVKALVKFWLQSHTPSTEPPPSFELWISDYFYIPTLEGPVCWEPGGGHHCDRPGREWTYTCTPGTGKTQIVCGLIRGLDGNLTSVIKAELANVMLDMVHKEAPDPRRLQDIYYNEKAGSLATYQFEVSLWLGPTCSQGVGMYSTLGNGLMKAGSVC